MELKSKKQTYQRNRKTSLRLSLGVGYFVFGFSFLCFCSPASYGQPKNSPEQLDPVNLMMPHLIRTSQGARTAKITVKTPGNVNVTNVPIQAVKTQSTLQQLSQISDRFFNITTVDLAARIDKELPQKSFAAIEDPNVRIKHKLWKARIDSPAGKKNQRSKNELERIIKQIHTIEFKPQTPPSQPVVVAEPEPATKPKDHDEKKITPEYSDTFSNKPQHTSPPPYEPVTDQTLEILRKISQQPDQFNNPFELAEVLFRSGRLKDAGIFYRQALNRTTSDNPRAIHDRAWILFQIGNCLRNNDPTAAANSYSRLMAEYPESPWAQPAKIQNKLIEWYQKDKPLALINQTNEFLKSSIGNGAF